MNPLYLVDPKLINTVDDVIGLESQFGICQTGRLLGLNPSDYVKLIYENVSLDGFQERKLQAFDEAMVGIKQFSVKGRFSDNPGMPWKAASVKSLRDGLVDQVIHYEDYEDIHDLSLDLKKRQDRSKLAEPKVSSFVSELKNIFQHSSSIIIVDPYFRDTDNRFDVLLNLIELGSDSRKPKSIEIIVSLRNYHGYYKEISGKFAESFKSKFNSKHKHTKVTYIIVNDVINPNLLHGRYILSNLGGLRFDRGIATAKLRKEEIDCLSLNLFNEYWSTYRNIAAEVPGSIVIPLNY